MTALYSLLILVPVALLSRYLGGPAVLTFGAAALGIVPLAALLGRATEALAERAGPQVSGLINGTLGNAAELIITFFAIRAGLLELVKASMPCWSLRTGNPTGWRGCNCWWSTLFWRWLSFSC